MLYMHPAKKNAGGNVWIGIVIADIIRSDRMFTTAFCGESFLTSPDP